MGVAGETSEPVVDHHLGVGRGGGARAAGGPGLRRSTAQGRPLGRQDGAHVLGGDLRGVGTASVEQQLRARRPAGGEIGRKPARQHQDADDLLALECAAGGCDAGVTRQPGEAARAAQALLHIKGVRSAVEIYNRHGDVLHLHGGGGGKDEQLDDGRDDQRQARARIAQHGDQFLANDGEQPLQHALEPLYSSRLCRRRQVRPKNSAPTASMNSMLGISTDHRSPARNTVCSDTFM